MPNILYLASASKPRRDLLEDSKIAYKIISQNSVEPDANDNSVEDQVLRLAIDKMANADMDCIEKSTDSFILTADTMAETAHSKQCFGKPRDITHAKQMFAAMRNEPIRVITGCCLEKRRWQASSWKTVLKETWITDAKLEMYIPENLCDEFVKQAPIALKACGATVIEGYGQQFLKSIHGSYSAVMGLPLFELREKLVKIGFYS